MNQRFLVRAAAAIAIIASSLLTGCASIVNGTNQVVTVEARSQGQLVKGASCKLQNAKGVFYVTSPGTVTVHKSRDDLVVQCDKENIKPGLAKIKSTVKGMTFGNILFGGVIGVVVDQNSGAAFDYPPIITVLMGENGIAQTAAIAPAGSSSNSVAPSVTSIQGTPGSYVKRQLTGEEMRTHFVNLGTVSGHNPGGAKMLYEVGQDGSLLARNIDKGGSTTGAYEIKEAENKICIAIYGGNVWRMMQDCYRLYQVGADMFEMKSATDNYFFTYINPQYIEANNTSADHPGASPSAASTNPVSVASGFANDHPSAALPSASTIAAPAGPAAPSPELPTEKIGQYSYQSEHIARAQSCSTAPHAILNATGPGFESYTVACDNGDALAMRCDFGQCRILK
jgi:hypothetical protein